MCVSKTKLFRAQKSIRVRVLQLHPSYLEAYTERERQCDHDEPPGDSGEEPPAQADAVVALVRCRKRRGGENGVNPSQSSRDFSIRGGISPPPLTMGGRISKSLAAAGGVICKFFITGSFLLFYPPPSRHVCRGTDGRTKKGDPPSTFPHHGALKTEQKYEALSKHLFVY